MAAAVTMRSRCESRMVLVQYSLSLDWEMISLNLSAGCVSRLKSGMKPLKIALQSSCPAITATTPKKLNTMMPTRILRMISKYLTPLLSYIHTTAVATMKSRATHKYFPLFSSGKMPRFCCSAAVPRENCGMAHTRLASMAAISQPQPSTGLICRLMAWNGFSPVESVT